MIHNDNPLQTVSCLSIKRNNNGSECFLLGNIDLGYPALTSITGSILMSCQSLFGDINSPRYVQDRGKTTRRAEDCLAKTLVPISFTVTGNIGQKWTYSAH